MNNQLLLMLSSTFLFEEDMDFLLQHINKSTNNKILKCALFMFQEHSMFPKELNVETWLVRYQNVQFYRLFRMERKTMEILVRVVATTDTKRLLSKKYSGGHHPIALTAQMLIFLWYMATQDSLLSIGSRFNVSPSTVMNIVNKLLYFILKLKKKYISFPATEEELSDVDEGFQNFPGVVGALDGSHIFVKIDKDQQESYIDRYRRHSINLMAICESNSLFTYVFVGFPGSAHDSRVFSHSMLYQEIETYGANYIFMDDQRFHLIGDSAFGLKSWLMTPFKRTHNLTQRERFYNSCLSKDRVVIEHAFGLLKGRWRRIQYINTYNICKTIEIATAACILHNFCIINSDLWSEEIFYEERIPVNHVEEDQREGRIKRDNIARALFINRR